MQGIFLWRVQYFCLFMTDRFPVVQNAGSRSRINFAISRLYSCIHATWLHCGHVWRATCRSTCSTFDVVKKGAGSLCGFRNSSRMLYRFFVASHGLKMLHFPNADSLFSRYFRAMRYIFVYLQNYDCDSLYKIKIVSVIKIRAQYHVYLLVLDNLAQDSLIIH